MNDEIIKGYNEEKNILARELSLLTDTNINISTRSSIENRLYRIDEMLKKLSK